MDIPFRDPECPKRTPRLFRAPRMFRVQEMFRVPQVFKPVIPDQDLTRYEPETSFLSR